MGISADIGFYIGKRLIYRLWERIEVFWTEMIKDMNVNKLISGDSARYQFFQCIIDTQKAI